MHTQHPGQFESTTIIPALSPSRDFREEEMRKSLLESCFQSCEELEKDSDVPTVCKVAGAHCTTR